MKKIFILMLLPMVMSIVSCEEDSKYEAVDLGLSVKWATCNVGATKPEEYGDYFAWGETEPYYTEGHSQDNPCSNWKGNKNTGYDILSYKWFDASDWCMSKYTTSSLADENSQKKILDAADDAATANWGSDWRMPTGFEQIELFSQCVWTWTTLNGVNGYKVVGPNGNSIFLPLAGWRNESHLKGTGLLGFYWSCELYPNAKLDACAYVLKFGKGIDLTSENGIRFYGFPVRPVRK